MSISIPARWPWALAARAALSALLLGGCTDRVPPRDFGATPPGDGPRLRYELVGGPGHAPFPSDLFTVPDPSSPTGLRLNVALPAPTAVQRALLAELNRLPGFGVTAPITVPFARESADPAEAALDLDSLLGRHGPTFDFADDAVYLLDLARGVPVPLDLGAGANGVLIRDEGLYAATDPRRREPSLELETVDERVDPVSGLPDLTRVTYSPAIDGDADGLLDVPNLLDPQACRQLAPGEPGTPEDDARDRCLADNLVPFYERDGDTLVLRPLLPLRGGARYAVVLTDRLVDRGQNPVRSPLDTVYHPAQRSTAEEVSALLEDPTATARFGDLAGTGLAHVAFTWSFTTAPVLEELARLAAGLSGRGDLAALAASFPAQLTPATVVGPVPEADLAGGAPEPAGWEDTPECAPHVARPHAIDGTLLRERVRIVAPALLGVQTLEQRAALADSLARISHVVLAELDAPYLLSGGPSSGDPDAAFDRDRVEGQRGPYHDRIPIWIFVPRSVAGASSQPFDAVVYAHGYGGSALEALPLAGALAAQGLATVAFDATGHGPDATAASLLQALLLPTCHARGLTAALATRAHDLDGDGDHADDVGRDARNGRPAHVRDVLRQTALDLVAIVRALRASDPAEDPRHLDFDADGARDVGGPDRQITLFGRSLGGAAAVLAGPLTPEVRALAALGAPGTLVDPWLRTGDPAAFFAFNGTWVGPAVLGFPAAELPADATACAPTELSLRLTAIDAERERDLEFACVDPAGSGLAKAGGAVVVTNVESLERRCARVSPTGRFRVEIPADANDRLHVALFDRADAIASYDPEGGCAVAPDTPRVATVYEWGAGPIATGTTDGRGVVICSAPRGCTEFQGHLIPAGDPLRALTAGAGLGRQNPRFRRWMDLARHVTAPGDPAAFAPHLGLTPPAREGPDARAATAALLLTPVGSLEVPVDVQVALARSAGLVPFLQPSGAEGVPELADYVTPEALFTALGGKTPHQQLVASAVLEALPRLARTPPFGPCGNAELSLTEAPACHPACAVDDDCTGSRVCDLEQGGRCRLPDPSEADCARTLADPDALDEGRARDGAQEPATPLRLARLSAPAQEEGNGAVWEPRLTGAPRADDFGAWAMDKPTLALFFPYLAPQGRDRLRPPEDCAAFDADQYLLQLVARFLATGGLDPYPLSHPASHRCLEDLTCPFHPALP